MENNVKSLTTANAVWITTALLHRENKDKDAFQSNEIFHKLKDLGLNKTEDVTIKAHISTHCVANTKAWPNPHRKLLRVSTGWYRLFRPGDPFDPSRENGQTAPMAEEIPSEYSKLITWYHNEYCKVKSKVPQAKTPAPNYPYTRIENDGIAKIPNSVLKKLHLQEGDFVVFVEGLKGELMLKKARLQLEVS